MQVKRNPKTGALQQWVNGKLVLEWGDATIPEPDGEALKLMLDAVMDAFANGGVYTSSQEGGTT